MRTRTGSPGPALLIIEVVEPRPHDGHGPVARASRGFFALLVLAIVAIDLDIPERVCEFARRHVPFPRRAVCIELVAKRALPRLGRVRSCLI